MRIAIAVLIALVVGLAPFALGSNRPLPWSYNAFLVGIIVMLAGVALLVGGRSYPKLKLETIAFPLLLVVGVLVWAGVQLVPLGALTQLHPVWDVSRETLDQSVAGTISVNMNLSGWALLRWATLLGCFGAVYCIARDPLAAKAMFWTLVTLAVASAAYGLMRTAFSLDQILWYQIADGGFLTAGFINRNSAATFFAMISVATYAAWLDALRRYVRKRQEEDGITKLEAYLQSIGSSVGLIGLTMCVLFVACMATASRGGIAALMCGLLVVSAMYLLRKSGGSSASGGTWLGAIIASVVLILVLFEASGGRLAARLSDQGALDFSARAEVYGNTLVAIKDYLLTGSGLGTFQDVYPAYRIDIDGSGAIWDKAHNDYLELVLGLGLPASLILALAGMLIFKRLVSGFFQRHREAFFPAAAVGATTVASVHSLVDFSLQMQANSLLFAVLVGCGCAQARSSRT